MRLSVIFHYLNLSGERVYCKTVKCLFHLGTVLLGQGFLYLFPYFRIWGFPLGREKKKKKSQE